jgi:hypothetical protein
LNGFADCLTVDFIAAGKKQFQATPFSRMRKEVEIVNKLGCTRDRRRCLSGA